MHFYPTFILHVYYDLLHTPLSVLNKLFYEYEKAASAKESLTHIREQQTELRIHAFKSKERGGGMWRDALFKFQWSLLFAFLNLSMCPLVASTSVFHLWEAQGPSIFNPTLQPHLLIQCF